MNEAKQDYLVAALYAVNHSDAVLDAAVDRFGQVRDECDLRRAVQLTLDAAVFVARTERFDNAPSAWNWAARVIAEHGEETAPAGTKEVLEKLTTTCPDCEGDDSGGGVDEPPSAMSTCTTCVGGRVAKASAVGVAPDGEVDVRFSRLELEALLEKRRGGSAEQLAELGAARGSARYKLQQAYGATAFAGEQGVGVRSPSRWTGCDVMELGAIPVTDEASEWLVAHPTEHDALLLFVGLMVREMAANNGKGNRPGWLTMDRGTAIAEVHWHAAKLAVAAKTLEVGGDRAEEIIAGSAAARAVAIDEVREYAADVANCALMALDCLGLLLGNVPREPRPEPAPHIHDGRESL